jgi:hypothetical protein
MKALKNSNGAMGTALAHKVPRPCRGAESFAFARGQPGLQTCKPGPAPFPVSMKTRYCGD